MNVNEQAMLVLLRSAVTGEPGVLPQGFDRQELYGLIKRHGVHALAFSGGLRCSLPKEDPLMQKLFQKYGQCVLVNDRQLGAVQKIFDAFQANGIDFMPVKGCNMKSLYPSPELRPMGDADILIRMEQYEKIRPIMEGLGFTEDIADDHCFVWQSKALEAEIHRRLIPSTDTDLYSYYGDWWRRKTIDTGSRHDMVPEDAFIYIFNHFTKHYRGGGIGCRHVLDLWVFLRSYPALDTDYIESEFRALGLLEFYRNIRRLIAFWFENGDADGRTLFLSRFILDSGVWGQELNHRLSAGVKESTQAGSSGRMRRARFLYTVFPPITFMKKKYPFLGKWPVLLPFAWIHRGCTAVLFRRDNISVCLEKTSSMTDARLSDYERGLAFVGLNFETTSKPQV